MHSVLLYAVDAMHENTVKLNGFGTRATNTTTFLRGIPAGVQRTIYITLPYIFCSISFNFMLLLCSTSQGTCILLLHQEASIFIVIKHKACATVTFFHLGLPSSVLLHHAEGCLPWDKELLPLLFCTTLTTRARRPSQCPKILVVKEQRMKGERQRITSGEKYFSDQIPCSPEGWRTALCEVKASRRVPAGTSHASGAASPFL